MYSYRSVSLSIAELALLYEPFARLFSSVVSAEAVDSGATHLKVDAIVLSY
jgi:hypothetical protein